MTTSGTERRWFEEGTEISQGIIEESGYYVLYNTGPGAWTWILDDNQEPSPYNIPPSASRPFPPNYPPPIDAGAMGEPGDPDFPYPLSPCSTCGHRFRIHHPTFCDLCTACTGFKRT